MEDNFLEAAILNWDDIEARTGPVPAKAEPLSSPQAGAFNPSAVLLALYVLAVLVLIYRWYIGRAHPR
jgi:hypothetical protein